MNTIVLDSPGPARRRASIGLGWAPRGGGRRAAAQLGERCANESSNGLENLESSARDVGAHALALGGVCAASCAGVPHDARSREAPEPRAGPSLARREE